MNFLFSILGEFWQLLEAPFVNPDILWIVVPLLAVMFVSASYFFAHTEERIGWDTALTNSAALFFVGINLLRTIYHYSDPASFSQFVLHYIKTLLIILVMAEGVLLSYTAFKHVLSERIMFFLASPIAINVQIYVLVVLVYLQVRPNISTFFAAILLFLFVRVLFWGLGILERRILSAKVGEQ